MRKHSEEIVAEADTAMYADKKRRKATRDDVGILARPRHLPKQEYFKRL